MKLNKECVRDVLLCIESNQKPGIFLQLNNFYQKLEAYSKEDIDYTLLKLKEADYINGKPSYGNDRLVDFSVGSITWDGHQFLDTIRDPKIWSKAKSIGNKLEDISITLLSKIGTNIIEDVITGKITL